MRRARTRTARLPLVVGAVALLVVDEGLAAAAPASETCVAIPAEVEDAPVHACETASTYELTITGERFVYDKERYRAALRRALRAFMRGTPTEGATAKVEIWLAVPEADPGATQMRAYVRTSRGDDFVAYLSPHPASLEPDAAGWNVTPESVGVLGTQRYPDAFGARAGRLVAKAASGASPADLEALLARHGAREPEPLAPGWWIFAVDPLRERATLDAVAADPDAPRVTAKLALDELVEWIARREKVFAFSLGSP